MAQAIKDWDCRDGEKVYAYKAGADVLAKHLEAAKAAGVVKEETDGQGPAARRTSRNPDPA